MVLEGIFLGIASPLQHTSFSFLCLFLSLFLSVCEFVHCLPSSFLLLVPLPTLAFLFYCLLNNNDSILWRSNDLLMDNIMFWRSLVNSFHERIVACGMNIINFCYFNLNAPFDSLSIFKSNA
uniref:Uncharacterized protein n=1 Tax=Anopheles darlingi TaxID=43151 RepID=A0A2M4D469_ANODA